MLNHLYYITPEEYQIAEKYGVNRITFERRLRRYNWSKERAMTTPIRKKKDHRKWVKIALENNIPQATYYSRVNDSKWHPEKAATHPVMNRSQTGRPRKHPIQ